MVEASEANALDELHAILFGEGRYERPDAPEFSLFADLTPVFSAEQLEYALDALISVGAGVASEKRRVIGEILAKSTNLTPDYLGSLALRAPEAIPYFSADQAEAALNVIRGTQGERDIGYLDTIIGLSTRLSIEKALPVLLDEAQTTAKALDAGEDRSQDLAWFVSALAARLSALEARKESLYELETLEDAVRRIPDAYYRALALISLAQVYPLEVRERRLHEAWREMPSELEERNRAELQVIIASLLEGDDRSEAVEQAFRSASALDPMDDLRLVLLVLLSLAQDENPFDAAETPRGRIIAVGLSPYETGKILWPSAPEALTNTLARLARIIPDALETRFRRWVHLVELDIASTVQLPLAPYLTPEQVDRLLDQFREISGNPELQLEWLDWLAGFLRGQRLEHALYVLGEYVAPRYQLMGFTALLPALTEAELGAAERFCRNLGEGWYGWRAWAALAERFPQLPASIPEAATQVSGEALRRLWLQQTSETRDWLTREMVTELSGLYGGAAPSEAWESRVASHPERLEALPQAPAPEEMPRMKMEAPQVVGEEEYMAPAPAAGYESKESETAAELAEEEAVEPVTAPAAEAEELPTWMYSLPSEMMEEAPAEAAAEGEPPAEEVEEAFGAAPAATGAEPAAPLIPVTGGREEEAAPEEAAAEEEITGRLAAPAPQPAPAAPPPPSAGAFPSLLRRIESGERRRSAAYDYVGGAAPSRGVVSTGFAPQQKPDQAITDRAPLQPGGEYYFLFSIGERRRFDIAPPDRPIHAPLEKLPPKARLQVALFAFPGEIEITPGKDVGELVLLPNRTVTVLKQVAEPAGLSDKNLLKQVLFFPVRIPTKPGSHRLRVNLYCQGVLVQSYQVQAQTAGLVGRLAHRLRGKRARPALETSLDYTLSNDLNTEVLTALEVHSLSLMINDNGNGTHGFRFFGGAGQEVLKGDASFTGLDLQNLIEQGRGALRRVAWGETTEWEPSWNVEQRYRYFHVRGGDWKERLRADLVILAKWGWRFYTVTLRHLAEFGAGSQAEADERRERVEQALANTSLIQIAAKDSLRHVLPAALIYDYPIVDTFPSNMFSLCPEFSAALDAGTLLEETVCFQGACPSRGNLQVICPSGFWGYRHVLGLPVSIGADVGDVVVKITYKEAPTLTASFSTDFTLRASHFQNLHQLRTPLGWLEADTGQQTLEYLRTANPHLVYFYCHGGLTEEKVPYLQVGPKNDAWGLITPSVLPAMRIRWSQPRPLVFINGCHTTALEPEAALDMVSGFVRDAGAAGVVGTEITIFEPLATAFAEECLRLFLNGTPIGQAVRKARLKLLQEGNPLGLVYIPFAVASLAMTPE